MKPLNYKEINDYQAIIVNEVPCLFTNSRIDRATLPENLYAYDIQSDGGSKDFVTIEKWVTVNHTGTILTDHEIPMTEGDFTSIEDYNFTDNEGSDKLLAMIESKETKTSSE
jgi:hypothetical protein